ncbi:DUF2510 domain-containing protein [Aquihabitans daechungensis]|uniref:DUF2510 domain-containing protein n=1 Tax=Aquihabitans daechungensis TaxID=1052257 RepID=UPI003B9FFFFC
MGTPPSGDDEAVEAADERPAPPTIDQSEVGEVPARPVPTQVQPPVPGVTAPGFGLTPGAPWAPYAPQAGGRPGPVGPAGWHPDPAGRHQYRWFDGSRWTEHVGDDGVASTDEGIV